MFQHGASVGRSLIRRATRAPVNEFVKGSGDVRVFRAGGGDNVIRVLVGNGDCLIALVGLFTGQHFKHHDAQGIDVTSQVCLAPRNQLGGEVGDGPQQSLRSCGVVGGSSGKAEISYFDATVIRKQKVFGFQVPMHDARRVGCVETVEHRGYDVKGLPHGEGSKILQQLSQRDAWQIFHHDVGEGAFLALIEDIDDVWVRKASCLPRFLDEAPGELSILGEVRVHDLDGHRSL